MNRLIILTVLACTSSWATAQTSLTAIEEQIEHLVIDQNEAESLEIYVQHEAEQIYHNSWGWKDKANKVPLQKGLVYNVRSMTKPMIGTLVHIFLSRGLLHLDDKVSQYLPCFTCSNCQDLTIEQMLLHRAGYSQGMPGKSWTQHPSLKSMVEYWGKIGPHNPGNMNWSYADAHADIVARILEVVSGKSLEELFRDELFVKMNLQNTFAASSIAVDGDSIMPLYQGAKGSWSCIWRPTDGSFYGFAMGAQSVFSTARDYARYMQLYLNDGIYNQKQILTTEEIESTFTNKDPIAVPPGLFPLADNGSLYYGHFWGMIDLGSDDPNNSLPDVFMHQGSDGTAAYAFTKKEIIVVVLTQSRGTAILPKVERLLLQLIESLR